MGLVFDQNASTIYETWYRSSYGRALDRAIEKLMLSQIRPKPGERVLDVGCGTGHHILTLHRLGIRAAGIDASPFMIHQARERLGKRVELRTGTAEDLPFDDNEFDVVVLINTLEFIDDPLAALREAGRVAHRKVFIGVLNSLSWAGLVKRMQGYLGNALFRRARFYHLWQIKSLVQAAYGPVPISWGCTSTRASLPDNPRTKPEERCVSERSPFGSFLGVGATMNYLLRTEPLPLKVRFKDTRRSFVSAQTLGDINRKTGE